jgi:hypothetical protein
MKRVIMMVLLLIAVTGCSTAMQNFVIDGTSLATQSATLKNQYANVEQAIRLRQTELTMFSDEEWRKLLNVDATIDMFIMKIDALTQFQAVASIDEISFMYQQVSLGYQQAREVIQGHWGELPADTQVLLQLFDQRTQDADEEITKLLENPDNDSVMKTISLVTGVLTIAVKMLGLVVL